MVTDHAILFLLDGPHTHTHTHTIEHLETIDYWLLIVSSGRKRLSETLNSTSFIHLQFNR